MTHIDPGTPNGAGKGDGQEAISMPDDSQENREEASGGTYSDAHAAGGTSSGAHETGSPGGTSGSDEFLGVEKDFWLRLLYVVAAGFVAWVSFWFIIILAVAQIIYRLAAGHANADLRGFTGNMIRYMRDLLAFITLVSDERPFLFGGKFPEGRGGDT